MDSPNHETNAALHYVIISSVRLYVHDMGSVRIGTCMTSTRIGHTRRRYISNHKAVLGETARQATQPSPKHMHLPRSPLLRCYDEHLSIAEQKDMDQKSWKPYTFKDFDCFNACDGC